MTNPCIRRYPYVRPQGQLMTMESLWYGTPCTTEQRTVTDPQGDEHDVTFLDTDEDEDDEA